jgi:hypothetical protein
MVERLFSELTQKQLERLAVTSVADLISTVTHYLDHRNEAPRPYTWTKDAKTIIAKINRGLNTRTPGSPSAVVLAVIAEPVEATASLRLPGA